MMLPTKADWFTTVPRWSLSLPMGTVDHLSNFQYEEIQKLFCVVIVGPS
jgi:hypothetical protein